ncbi:hypothetical protein DSLASN_04280 [Desulfoluna limicola]|uniref:DUF2860 domain-containing protein n=1 Tax=Desulfoluna limicola TaxID=2810562 RepID=A0ABN6EYU2_9BACT|nr:DUF2860 family protein [Desulfoluna limicola]BCS94796.1 hypothetical protein DSLASN_04280 [Desulfoluna limicola]
MKKPMYLLVLTFALLGIVMPAHAILPIPQESGFSGFVNVGVGVIGFESNMIAGNNISDTSGNRIDSLTASPDTETNATPVLNFEAAYTFGETRTQVFAGNQLEDLVRYDTSTLAGLRQELPDKSIVSIAYVFTSFPTSVWEDPYVVNANRSETDRSADGLRFGFDRILGSKFEVEFTWRDITIDTERSGQTQLGLSTTDAALLDRNGNMYSGKVTYTFPFEGLKHILIPTLEYSTYDLDGGAMAFDRYGMLVSYVLNTQKINFVTNLYYARSNFDKENPIYVEKRNDDVFGASFSAFYKKFLGVPKMNLVGTVAAYESDSNIDFYDTGISMASISVLYRF